ncbi:AAA family ATPase [Nocardioides caldifontis]|uniref:AAA family ATPase n=1 Tax=Nocardioides caldifontis TaxID=2588938 RepID=UPI0011E043C0|nr:AAA family ATPase [Nocardioides caldifontis]
MIARVVLAISREDLRSQTMASLAEMQDVEVLGVVENSNDLLLAIDTNAEIDLVVLDDQIGALPYLALTRELIARQPDLGVLLLTADPSPAFYASAMDAGARAVLEAPPSVDELAGRIPTIIGWQRQVRGMGATGLAAQSPAGRLIAFTGAKGGVGTTTAALHAALLAAAASTARRVCLIDFDLQQRGVRQLLDLNGRRTVIDLANVADSLTGRNLDEAVFVHQSGLRVLLAPTQGEQAEDITSEIARQVLAAAKSHFDLVIVDCGAVVTEASAVGMEFADDILLVTTSDVPSLRASHDKIELLSRLQVAKSSEVHLLFNKVSPRNEVQPELGRRMTGAQACKVTLPEDWRRLEPVANSLSPLELEDGPFRRAVVALGRELGLGAERPRPEPVVAEAATGTDGAPPPVRRRGRRRAKDEAGQVTIEAMVGIVAAMLIFLVLMQTALYAIATVSSRRAADAAAIVGSRGGSNSEALRAAEQRTPGMYRVHVKRHSDEKWEARLEVPSLVPFLDQDISATAAATD